jgi:Zn-dependent protease with chaperone function
MTSKPYIMAIPSLKRIAFYSILKDKIYISYGELEQSSDIVLQATLYHEIKHQQLRVTPIMIWLSFMSYYILCLCLPFLLFFLFPFYLILCFMLRLIEYECDRYALSYFGRDAMIEFLDDLKPDTFIKSLFFVFYWHPTIKKRKKKILKIRKLEY